MQATHPTSRDAQVEVARRNVRQVAHGLPLRGYQEHVGDALRLEKVENRGGIEGPGGRQHDRLAQRERRDDLSQAGDMEYGRGAQRRPPVAEAAGRAA